MTSFLRFRFALNYLIPMFGSVRYRGSNSYSADNEEQQDLLTEHSDEDDRKYATSYRFSTDHIPWKGILLAVVLNLVGSFMLLVYICSLLGIISFQPTDSLSYLALVFITLVPGCYHCVIAWKALRGHEGYSLDDIADLN